MLGFIDTVRQPPDRRSKKNIKVKRENLSSDERVHRKFLFYNNFFAAQMPLILAEGDTDNVYLTHAIRMLAADFPLLAKISDRKKIILNVRLFKYTKSSTARLVNLHDGGVGDLQTFIRDYFSETRGFYQPASVNPVIVVFDNDAGASDILNAVRDVTKTRAATAVPFIHLTQNLYAVSIADSDSNIENLFDETAKSLKIDDKSFYLGKDFDKEIHFGKKVFAHKIIRPNESKINFAGFHPLLNQISLAIAAHKEKSVTVPDVQLAEG